MSYWSIPRCWPGATVAVLGAGPSITRAQVDQCIEADTKLIAVNRSYELIPEDARAAAILHSCDSTFWSWYPDAREFSGIKTTLSAEIAAQGWGVHLLRDAGPEGFVDDPSAVTTGWNGGFQAICIAAKAGARRIVLLGFDMNDGGHWHQSHPDGGLERDWKAQLPCFSTLVEPLKARSVDVVNATPGSALKAFRAATLASLLQ